MLPGIATAVLLCLAAPGSIASSAEAGMPRSAAVRPVAGAVITPFDPPAVPWGAGSRGVKLAAPPGTPVRAALPGTVTFAGSVAGAGWVTVDHGGGLDTTYGEVTARVGAGRRVRAGEVVGALEEERDHLHWGARLDGAYLDPLSLLRLWRPRLVPLGAPGP